MRSRSTRGVLLGLVAGLCPVACSDQPGAEAQPVPAGESTPSTAPRELPFFFVDATAESGLDAFRQENGGPKKLFVIESFGAGVALFDADGDGDLDAYLTNGSHLEGMEPGDEPRDALFLNDGSGHFVDGTDAAGLGDTGWTTGVRVVDLEGDGDQDLYLTNWGPNVLYRNRGDGTFEDVTETAGVGDPRWSTGACFLDFDRDGDLDLYVANYLVFDAEEALRVRRTGTIMAHRTSGTESSEDDAFSGVEVMFGPRGLPPDRDRFYVNQGDGTFRDASVELGIDGRSSFGFQCIAFDADRDGSRPGPLRGERRPRSNLPVGERREASHFSEVRPCSPAVALSMSEALEQAGMGVGRGRRRRVISGDWTST